MPWRWFCRFYDIFIIYSDGTNCFCFFFFIKIVACMLVRTMDSTFSRRSRLRNAMATVCAKFRRIFHSFFLFVFKKHRFVTNNFAHKLIQAGSHKNRLSFLFMPTIHRHILMTIDHWNLKYPSLFGGN